jgi:hypothetical protein
LEKLRPDLLGESVGSSSAVRYEITPSLRAVTSISPTMNR